MKTILRLQLSDAVIVVALLLSFLLLNCSPTSILTTGNEHIALAIPNVNINNTSVKPTTNHPPVANAGPNQIVNENTTVSLVGAGIDSDPNDTLSYLWRQTNGPAVNLSNRSSTNPTFTALIVSSDSELKFSLTVTDDKGATSSPAIVTITVKAAVPAPLATPPPSNISTTSPSEGQYSFVRTLGSKGIENGEFIYPSGIAVDSSSGNMYVADVFNNRIQKFTGDGTFVTKWGSEGSGDGQFRKPFGIAVDSQGNVYVLDSNNNRIQKFTGDGTFVTKWGSEGSGDGQFKGPHGIAIDSSGYVYVSDTSNNRIEVFSPRI